MGLDETILRLDQSFEFIILFNFLIGVILGPTSFGLLYYLMFLLVYEIIVSVLTNGGKKYLIGQVDRRLFYIAAGFFGWIVGRTANQVVLEREVSFLPIQSEGHA